MEESVALLDIFRLLVTPSISDKETNSTQEIKCLDLSSQLLEKKILDQNVTNPWDKLQPIIFERLMIEDYQEVGVVSVKVPGKSPNFERNSSGNEFSPSDSHILRYLYGCYFRLQQIVLKHVELKDFLSKVEALIFDQVILYLSEPDLFPDREKRFKNNQPAPLLLNLVNHFFSRQDDLHITTMTNFVNQTGEVAKKTGGDVYSAIVDPTYTRLMQKFVSLRIDDPSLQEWCTISRLFLAHQPEMAEKFLMKNFLINDNSIAYQSTLLGFMLSISHLPRTGQNEITFFKYPTTRGESEHRFTETQLGLKLQILCQELHKIFHSLLKMPQTRNKFLLWLGRCLNTFKDRKKLWSNQLLMTTSPISVNDGFLMNFLTVMLHLSEPFAGPYNLDSIVNPSFAVDKKLLRVDPRYCKWSKVSHDGCKVHFLGLSEETFLINKEREHPEETGDEEVKTNFISECFYGTHQAFTFAFRSIYERFFKLAQNINELQRVYADIVTHPIPSQMSRQDPREIMREKIDADMTQFYNLKAVLMAPHRIKMQLHFCIATAAFLNHLVACSSLQDAIDSKEFRNITLDCLREKKTSRECLAFIPEMLVENVLDFFLFLKNFNEQALVEATSILEPLMTLIITFMGNSSLMQNPHLRARFAEILECLMPHQSYHSPTMVGCADLFENHPLSEQIAPSLVNVFVSIEMTGEGVQFEQKFSYRRPMYIVLEYLWGQPIHKNILIQLAKEAEVNIESARPPLFLRFINLLINDAIFLLDEALGYMNQLKEAERRRKTEEWQRLPAQQRHAAENSYSHIGRLARFHNVLSLSTIGTLAWLTSEIKTLLCHPTLVDRIANMLNYFLEHLVGPKKGKFNVNDKNDYEFKPREILEKICRIYINLGQDCKNTKCKEFCTAVSSDGRSYSENLLPQATEILFRTGMSSLGTEFEKLSQLVRKIAIQNQMDEIPVEDVPDTFLDPIMSTIMTDPVLLPSSNIIVDRSTIARHLLSDQTDPFNRSPLSMEDVIPETDLKKMIEMFLKDRREAMKASKGEQSNQTES